MDTAELAHDFAAKLKTGDEKAAQAHWSDNIVSLEAFPGDMARIEGRAGVEAKGAWWYDNHDVHSVGVEGPFVHGDQFALRFALDVTPKDGDRMQMTEIGLYTVSGGKIVEERFFPAG